ncbi:hypothetical protein, partial [Erythrobacter sp. YJ-T3-07]|uniref:hypothetical protein n=1 Tax=Erythrobacter sp. YJ-T3-07 TaxID=2793063 RepID=UPI001F215280
PRVANTISRNNVEKCRQNENMTIPTGSSTSFSVVEMSPTLCYSRKRAVLNGSHYIVAASLVAGGKETRTATG